ncbi:MAG: hypothetical protein RIB03_09780 [Henriciella sp.]|uniref:hypothetical protein n=1 Tax=Henriciella sp. TaxID=1968823 RepID=UPI002629E46F|nr:hypothetical protein [Henriciella sp.]
MRIWLAALALFALPASAQQAGSIRYVCDMDGVQGDLTAHYEVVSPVAPELDAAAAVVSQVVGAGISSVFYSGELTSPLARYVFTGQNEVAEFTDLSTKERFLVEMHNEGETLRLTANPNAPDAEFFLCHPPQS